MFVYNVRMNYFLYIVFLVLSLLPLHVFAAGQSIVINEIMYNLKEGSDTGREWIEIYNAGSQGVDLSTYKLFEANTAHTLKVFQGNQIIPAGGYAILADSPDKFLADHAGFTGTIFDTTFSLSNDGESISIKDSMSVIVDSLTYTPNQGGNGDGSTLGKLENGFTSTQPTPGTSNTAFVAPPAPEINTSGSQSSSSTSNASEETISALPVSNTSGISGAASSVSTHSEVGSLVSVKEVPIIKVDAGRNRLVSIHAPVLFSTRAVTKEGDTPSGVSYSWSFGDGFIGYGATVEHVFQFAGEYNVVLIARDKEGTKVTSRTKVSVREPALGVSLSIDNNSFIAIENKSKEEINIGGWSFVCGQTFVLPQDTIIAARSTIRIPYIPTYKNGEAQTCSQFALLFPDTTMAVESNKILFSEHWPQIERQKKIDYLAQTLENILLLAQKIKDKNTK